MNTIMNRAYVLLLSLSSVVTAEKVYNHLPLANTSPKITAFSTIKSGKRIPLGTPRTITWAIAKDGSPAPEDFRGPLIDKDCKSFLIEHFDKLHPSSAPLSDDLTERKWFPALKTIFDIIESKTGIDYEYVPYDDGASHDEPAKKGKRADVRIFGELYDGPFGFNGYPNKERIFPIVYNLSKSEFKNLNTVTFIGGHEHVHGLGYEHISVYDGDTPSGNASVITHRAGNGNGPQFIDVIQLHQKYGDPYEKPQRNDSIENSTKLKPISAKRTGVGFDWNDTIWIEAKDTDLATLSDSKDRDVYFFENDTPREVIISLRPRGCEFAYSTQAWHETKEGKEDTSKVTVNATKFQNLAFKVYGKNGKRVVFDIKGKPTGEPEATSKIKLKAKSALYIEVYAEEKNKRDKDGSYSPQAYTLEIAEQN